MLALYAEAQSKRRCGEKTPQQLYHVPQLIRDFPNSRIVCLFQDGRDVSLSLVVQFKHLSPPENPISRCELLHAAVPSVRLGPLDPMPWGQRGLISVAEAWLKATEYSSPTLMRLGYFR